MEAIINVVQAQPERYGKDFDATMSYLGQMITKEGNAMQSICVAKTESKVAKPKVAAFMGKIECNKYPG